MSSVGCGQAMGDTWKLHIFGTESSGAVMRPARGWEQVSSGQRVLDVACNANSTRSCAACDARWEAMRGALAEARVPEADFSALAGDAEERGAEGARVPRGVAVGVHTVRARGTGAERSGDSGGAGGHVAAGPLHAQLAALPVLRRLPARLPRRHQPARGRSRRVLRRAQPERTALGQAVCLQLSLGLAARAASGCAALAAHRAPGHLRRGRGTADHRLRVGHPRAARHVVARRGDAPVDMSPRLPLHLPRDAARSPGRAPAAGVSGHADGRALQLCVRGHDDERLGVPQRHAGPRLYPVGHQRHVGHEPRDLRVEQRAGSVGQRAASQGLCQHGPRRRAGRAEAAAGVDGRRRHVLLRRHTPVRDPAAAGRLLDHRRVAVRGR
eukprot:1010211-Rhodomonas_salina.2